MLTVYIKNDCTGRLMSQLFKENLFDTFEIRSVSVSHFVKFDIDGTLLRKEPGTDGRRFALWAELKPYIFSFIKGKIKPKQIKIVFSMPRDSLRAIAPNAATAFINMEYENDEIRFVTATSQREFSLNKENDIIWDKYISDFFTRNGIDIE